MEGEVVRTEDSFPKLKKLIKDYDAIRSEAKNPPLDANLMILNILMAFNSLEDFKGTMEWGAVGFEMVSKKL